MQIQALRGICVCNHPVEQAGEPKAAEVSQDSKLSHDILGELSSQNYVASNQQEVRVL